MAPETPNSAACWDAAAFDSPEAVAAPTGSRHINRLLRGAWLSPPYETTTRDALIAAGDLVPAPEPSPPTPNDWSYKP